MSVLAISLSSGESTQALSKAEFCDSKTFVKLYDLVSKPKKYLKKEVNITGEFSSFTNLPLDYGEEDKAEDKDKEKAFRSSKDYIGILLSRPDLKEIPLVELKLVLPLKVFKKNDDLSQIEHGDVLEIEGKVFSNALGEPWVDIKTIRRKEKQECDT